MTRTHSSKLTILLAALAALAIAGAMLALMLSPATAQEGDGQESSVPAKPTGLSAEAYHDRVDLSWDDPGDDSITGYQVFRRDRDTQKAGEFTMTESGTGSSETSYTDTGVEPETRYVYRVKAINEHGASKWSGYARADTPAAPEPEEPEDPPAKPTGMLTAAAHDEVVLTWNDPQDDTITGYVVERREPGEDDGTPFAAISQDTGSAGPSYTDGTVEPERTYEYRVRAINPQGTGEPSDAARLTTPAAPDQEDGEPGSEEANVRVASGNVDAPTASPVPGSATSVRLTWDKPDLNGGPDITDYEVQYREGASGQYTRLPRTGGDRSIVIDGLTVGKQYQAQVRAYNGEEWSNYNRLRTGGWRIAPEGTLLSNLGQHSELSGLLVENFEHAQGFTTGPNPDGYVLEDIQLDVRSVPRAPADMTISIWSGTSDGRPDTTAVTLTHTGAWTTGFKTFQAPAGTMLDANTTYFVFASYSGPGRPELYITPSRTADPGSASGWEVGTRYQRSRTSGGDWTSRSSQIEFAVNGYIPSTHDIQGAVTLTAASPFSPDQPYVGIRLTAEVRDQNPEPVSNVNWQWARSFDKADWRDIDGADQAAYTPVREDYLDYLRVTATYQQQIAGETVEQTASAVTRKWTHVDISEPPGADFSDGPADSRPSPGRGLGNGSQCIHPRDRAL